MIEIKNVAKTYKSAAGDFTAIRNINLTIEDGDVFGIIGLSGAGKSTLVRCINLLEVPTEGDVIFDGQSMTKLSKKELLMARQKIGMIFQGFNLLSQRTALGNILYPLEIAGVPKAKATKRALELLELVGLADKAKSYPSQLSGGQKQRVAIARALATDPKVLLCDEATSALDPTTTVQILDLLAEINRKLGVTIVVITHEMKVIDSICDRVAVIDKSRIAELGDVRDIFAHPKSDIARELILPVAKSVPDAIEGTKLRLVFDGKSAKTPVIAGLVMECGIAVNILFADTRELDGRACGQMLIQLPDDERQVERVCAYLDEKSIVYHKEV